MSEPAVDTLTVQDFRSISGKIVVPVGASVVLIHGPNGAGKSSLVGALALALSGNALDGLASPKHLVHHNRPFASIELGTPEGPYRVRLTSEDLELPAGLLNAQDAGFFAERCYLEQMKLTRLLELYQQKRRNESDSALARFVKELLHLDELDALAEGLKMSRDVRRVRSDVGSYRRAEEEVSRARDQAKSLDEELDAAHREVARFEEALRNGLLELGVQDAPAPAGWTDDNAERFLGIQQHSARIDQLDVLARRAEVMGERWARVKDSRGAQVTQDAEKAGRAARERSDQWRKDHGDALETTLRELSADFPRLPSIESVLPSEAFDAAVATVDAELARLATRVKDDDAIVARLPEAEADRANSQKRLESLDRELVDDEAIMGLESLAGALAGLAPHVRDDLCPVCGRDYSEISDVPLTAHLAEEIARLSSHASRLQHLVGARLETVRDLRRAEEAVALLMSGRLPAERRSSEEARHERLTSLRNQLVRHEDGARAGGTIMRELSLAQATAARAHSQDRENFDLLREIHDLAVEAAIQQQHNEAPGDLLTRLQTALIADAKQAQARQTRRRQLAETRQMLLERMRIRDQRATEREELAGRISVWDAALTESNARMTRARVLHKNVEKTRSSIISSVFNSTLNGVWRELFVRLAPDEPYVPAFCEPDPDGPVSVLLETRRRDGTRGGEPKDMLSAGNLNTAALTLFLGLHLSVAPRVRWLLLDDPVQSMDEVHVTQFAALLRTLTQQHGRRVVIAVHERDLFDYLSLELSPPNAEADLVTVQMRRDRQGRSEVDVNWRKFEPDPAIAVA